MAGEEDTSQTYQILEANRQDGSKKLEISFEREAEGFVEAELQKLKKSVFNITVEELNGNRKSQELKSSEALLNQEILDWLTLYHKIVNDLKKSLQKLPVVNIDILPDQKRTYLKDAPNLQKFIRFSREFREEALIFIEMDLENIVEKQQTVKYELEHRLHLKRQNSIHRILSRNSEKKLH